MRPRPGFFLVCVMGDVVDVDARGQFIDYNQVPPAAVPRLWIRAPLNFDNVANSLLTLFTVQTRDNWPTYVHVRPAYSVTIKTGLLAHSWRYVALVVVLWRPALSLSASASSSSSASVTALK